ncbi:hypothetical protein ASD11_10200 [Aeromicrobium sp. Root495]|uniref:hypothetical protein n=1 Tax=Aeromicrobium sp. Root495 TaxID=1736550 RepID=UPI0006F63F3D|nr:hypothetical protein [Aeromicrobium sp. Root495]KQY59880.1 hypothetical protein ASD11_10200 [Aeromicrobium sp. Root495]
MDHEGEAGNDSGDAAEPRRYPAQARPEQPMHVPQSPWPWVVGLLVVAGVVFGGLLLWVMYEIGSNAG